MKSARMRDTILRHLRSRLDLPDKQRLEQAAAQALAEEIYRSLVSKELEDAVNAFPHREFVKRANSVYANCGGNYYGIQLGRDRPIKESSYVQLDPAIQDKITSDAEQQLANHPGAKIYAVLEGLVDRVPDHRTLYHLWPGVARYVDRYELRRGCRWPTEQKKVRKFALTEEEVNAIAQFTLTVKT